MEIEVTPEIINAIQRLKDGALKHGGNMALQDAVSIQMWLQQIEQMKDQTVDKTKNKENEKS